MSRLTDRDHDAAATPDVTVLLATAGRVATIGRALTSLTVQTLAADRFEVVVVVNGPDDGTAAYVAGFAAEHPDLEIRVVQTPVAGVAHARNLGLSVARGVHMTILDDDDWVSPSYLETLLSGVEPGIIPLVWMAEIFDGEEDTPSYDNYFSNAIQKHVGTAAVRPARLGPGISLNVCKLVPVAAAREVGYDERLVGGSDFVFWTKLFARHQFHFRVLPDRGAAYYRTRGGGSLSRRDPSFEFNVRMRLDCIESLGDVPPGPPDVERVLHNVITAQCVMINTFLKMYPDQRQAVTDAIAERHLPRFNWSAVNRGLARDLAVLYGFPPWSGTSGLVAARRIRERGTLVDVIAKDRDDAQARDESSPWISAPYVAALAAVPGRSHAPRWAELVAYSDGVFKTLETWSEAGKEYDSVYSRATWVAAHVVAAQYKLRHPSTRWIAEFSDPLSRDIHGEVRTAQMKEGPVVSELRAGVEAAGFPAPEGLALNEWGEQIAYALADEILFTNELQRSYMLSYCPDPALAERALSISRIARHPTPTPDLYDLGSVDYPLDDDRVHIAYFGAFYATRTLGELTEGLARLSGYDRARIQLHVFTDKVDVTQSRVWADGLGDVVRVNPYAPYTGFLNLTRKFDALIVNDAQTAGSHAGLNPYLPSKVSDYLGSGTPIWALYEPASSLSTVPVAHRSLLGDVDGAVEVLRSLIEVGPRPDRQRGRSAGTPC
ncbi:glycosyltransferase [Nocardioides sp. URHA0020]|uniref:glycosyltransferase n=1 Tax=Nocardioides sp. URHA0020 TaxID=1380392 RepID=UPI0006889657|nr:glycosyltransferase [Nocardioides sp. URHA0020]